MPSTTSHLDVDAQKLKRRLTSYLDAPARVPASLLHVGAAGLAHPTAYLGQATALARSSLSVNLDSIRITTSTGRHYYSWLDLAIAVFPAPPSTELEVTAGFSGFQSPAGAGTSYVGAGIDNAPEKVWFPWPVAVTITDIAVTTDSVPPGSGNSFVYTVQKNGVDTGTVLTIANAATSVLAGSLTLAFNAGDKFGMKLVRTGAVPAARHSWTVKTT